MPDQKAVRINLDVKMKELTSGNAAATSGAPDAKPIPQPVASPTWIELPLFNTLRVNQTLTIPAGNTAVLSGWKNKHEVTKKWALPLLSELPYLGSLYRYEWQEPVWERVLFLVTPRVGLKIKLEEPEGYVPYHE